MLPPLLRKAVGDAGFDLALGDDDEWHRVGVSGTDHLVWILPSGAGAEFAVGVNAVLQEFTVLAWPRVPLPRGAAGAVRCRSAKELYGALRRVRVLLDQLPPAPQHRFARRLAAINSTEAEVLVKQRVGQELFREMLMEYWGGRCAVTGIDVPELLRASHAKPWRDCDDRERLDVYNGLLLTVHFDALFDCGLMTFDDDGSGRFSSELDPQTLRLLMPAGEPRLLRLSEPHRTYLRYHRENVFRRMEA